MTERTSSKDIKTEIGNFSNIAYGKHLVPDPNNSFDSEAVNYWLEKCEWYKWNVRYFDSPGDLHDKLLIADFEDMHKDILKTQRTIDNANEKQWQKILGNNK